MAEDRQKSWYVEFPTYQYKEDVKSVARKNGLKIVNASFKGSKQQCENPPKLTLKREAKETKA